MGLFSDILEACRDGGHDPLLLQPGSYFCKPSYKRKTAFYVEDAPAEKFRPTSIADNRNTATVKQLALAANLEELKCAYLLSEKALLRITNAQILKSRMAKDKLNRLLFNIQKSYQSVCNTLCEIYKNTGLSNTKIEAPSEDIVCSELLELLMSSFVYSLKNSASEPLDTSSVRKVVSDMAGIIRLFQWKPEEQQDKKLVHAYLTKQMQIRTGQHQCQNCGNTLLKGIPYCLNCYERN